MAYSFFMPKHHVFLIVFNGQQASIVWRLPKKVVILQIEIKRFIGNSYNIDLYLRYYMMRVVKDRNKIYDGNQKEKMALSAKPASYRP